MTNTKAYKIKCLKLTQAKRDLLYKMCEEYAKTYNHVSKYLPSLPEWYWKGKTGHLYSKYVTQKKGSHKLKVCTEHITSREKLYAIQDAASNYKSAIANNKKSRKGLSIQEMRANIIKFDKKRYTIIKRASDEYGFFIGKSDPIFIPVVVGDFIELRSCLDAVIESKINPGAITYNYRDNTISLPVTSNCDVKFLKKTMLETYIGVDVGINNTMVLSAIQFVDQEPIVKKISIFSASELNNRLLRLKNKNNHLKSNGYKITNKQRNIQDTTSHQMSKKLVDFTLQFTKPVVFFENLKSMKKNRLRIKNKGKHQNKYLRKMVSAWNYAELITKCKYKLNAEGIWTMELNPMFTSQKCSKCGTIGIRAGKNFHCETCGYGCGSSPQGTIGQVNADVNASINIALTGLFVLYGWKGGRVALPDGQPNESVGNPILTDMNGIDGTTTVEAVSLKKQALACS